MTAVSGSSLIGLAAGAIGLAIMMGGAVAVLFAYFRKSTRDILREENTDLRDRLDTVEASDKNCKDRLARAEATIATLTDVVTGASAVEALKQTVEGHHQVIMDRLDQLSHT